MSTLLRHARFCVQDHDGDSCCESDTIRIGDIGEVHVLADEGQPIIYVDDDARGLYAEIGRYTVEEAELVALAMLEAVRVAKSGSISASGAQCASAGADS